MHFSTSQNTNIFWIREQILALSHIRNLIAGTSDCKDSFQEKVYGSFVKTLVQATYAVTKNIKEIIRFGRILWTRYIVPLQPEKIDETIRLIKRKLASFQPPIEATPDRVEQELLSFLDRKVLAQIRSLMEEHLFALSVPTTDNAEIDQHDMPQRAKYLLLASYLCQVNRPDRDKHLFSIQKNGRRRKSNTESNTASEDTAFGTNAMSQPKTLRLRTFPLERMLSIFVSLVTLHQLEANSNSESFQEDETEKLLSLGDASLQLNLEYLQDIGLLHEQPGTGPTDPIRLTGRRYWCDMTEDEALRLAETLHFPLTRYVL